MTDEHSPEAMASAMRSIEAAFLVDGHGATLAEASEVWLVRHGDCYDGIMGEDPPLSPQGRVQVRRLAERGASRSTAARTVCRDSGWTTRALSACPTIKLRGARVGEVGDRHRPGGQGG